MLHRAVKTLKHKLRKIRDKYYYLNYGQESICHFLRNSQYTKVLDIGCGKGRDLQIAKKYAKSNNLKLHGIDINTDTNLVEEGIDLLSVDIEKERLPFADKSFDIVIANQVLEHTKEIFWISNEICRVLKINGRFIIGVPNLAALHNRLLLLIGKHPTCIKTGSAHVRGFTVNDLVGFYVDIGGLELLEIRGENLYPFSPFVSKCLTKPLPNIAVSIFLLFEKKRNFQNNFIEYLEHSKLETPFFRGKQNPHPFINQI